MLDDRGGIEAKEVSRHDGRFVDSILKQEYMYNEKWDQCSLN